MPVEFTDVSVYQPVQVERTAKVALNVIFDFNQRFQVRLRVRPRLWRRLAAAGGPLPPCTALPAVLKAWGADPHRRAGAARHGRHRGRRAEEVRRGDAAGQGAPAHAHQPGLRQAPQGADRRGLCRGAAPCRSPAPAPHVCWPASAAEPLLMSSVPVVLRPRRTVRPRWTTCWGSTGTACASARTCSTAPSSRWSPSTASTAPGVTSSEPPSSHPLGAALLGCPLPLAARWGALGGRGRPCQARTAALTRARGAGGTRTGSSTWTASSRRPTGWGTTTCTSRAGCAAWSSTTPWPTWRRAMRVRLPPCPRAARPAWGISCAAPPPFCSHAQLCQHACSARTADAGSGLHGCPAPEPAPPRRAPGL